MCGLVGYFVDILINQIRATVKKIVYRLWFFFKLECEVEKNHVKYVLASDNQCRVNYIFSFHGEQENSTSSIPDGFVIVVFISRFLNYPPKNK